NVFTGLTDAGVYNIIVKDAKECVSIAIPVDITQPVILTASAAVTPFGCDATNAPQDAIVTITAIDGTPGYTYSFDGGNTFQASASFPVNTPQTINYVVHDANGCIANGSAVVVPYTPPTDMNLTATPIYCNTPGTVATVTVNSVTSGVAPYTYEIISPVASASNATGIFPGLAPDTYIIKVTDANGCSTTKTIIIEEADKISVTAALVNDVYCNGGATGAVNFTVSDYITAGNYTFSLIPAVGTMSQTADLISYTNLPAGNYTFTVTDGVSGCIDDVVNFAINEPAFALGSASVATNINCNNDNATVTITATGGTAPYKYAIARAADPVPTSFVSNSQLVVDTNNGADMNWIVYIKDNNDCDVNSPQVINVDANPTITNVVAAQCPSTINGTYDITITASGFSPALEYSIDGISFQTSNIITVNASGNYNVTVKDANGCISAPYPVTILQPLVLNAVVVSSPTCTDNDGVVTVSTTGGSGNYLYNIDAGTFGPAVFNTVASGSHTIGVRDTTTLCEVYVPITLTAATPITGFALATTPVTCNGGSDGTITATMATPAPGVNDNPVYMYSLNGGTPQASNIFTGLPAGNYTVDVVSERGCPATASIPVAEPGIITVPAPTVNQFGCASGSNAMNFATITVAGVTGGSGTYLNYEFIKEGTPDTVVQFGSSATYTEANLSGGTYIVNVYDSNSCIGSTAGIITINPFIALDEISVAINNAITCTNLENITVSASSIGGTPANLLYTLVDVNATTGVQGGVYPSQTNTTGIFTALPVANYLITVENVATGCSIQDVHYVNNPNTFELKAVKTSDVICFGSNEGAVTVNLIDNTIPPDNAGAFTYTVTGPVPSTGTSATAGPLNLTGLTAGQYSISASLVNNPFCSVVTTFTVNQPATALDIFETHTEITCITGNNDGSISVSAVGGWPGTYEFELTGPVNVAYSTQTNFTNLTAGSYTINVRDSKGCIDPITVNLVNPAPITFTASADITLLNCKGDKNATITASVPTGGQGSNYIYTLNTTSIVPSIANGPQTSPIFSGLGAGTYSISVTDGWGCSATSLPITITEPTEVIASLVKASSPTCLVQGTLTLSATGGTAPYSYSATPNFATVLGTFASSSTPISVPTGNYRYYVRDANGCTSTVSNDITIDPLPVLTINLDLVSTVINCKGENSGAINAIAKGGLGNYVYTLQDGAGNPIAGAVQASPGIFTQLVAGSYRVRVDSGDCNTTTAVISITEPNNPLVAPYVAIDATCNGLNNGKIVITASGGTGIIKYAISPDLNQFFAKDPLDTNYTFENLAPGTYEIITQDQNGCYIHNTGIVIDEPASIGSSVILSSVMPEMCFGDKDGEFTITITGGTAPYRTSLDAPNGTYITGQVHFTGLAGGEHYVYIKDANGCSSELPVPLPESVKLNPQAIVDYGCANNVPSLTVTVTIDPSITNPADVDYALDGVAPYQASNVFTNIAPGTHYITARHTNGCEKNTPNFTIAVITPLTLVLTNGGLNEIVATATGGGGGYQFTLDGEDMGNQNKFIYYKSGTYTIRVTDANGCFVEKPITVKFIDIKIPNVFTPNGDGDNDGWSPENTINYPDLVFFVFDRYGRKVGTYKEGEFWDGKYEGKELPTGDYWYVIRLQNQEDSREFVGHFTLYR
ncbi:MAG: T9SS type B sorting domain-containing protein, partial [Bacteroidota bacterium]